MSGVEDKQNRINLPNKKIDEFARWYASCSTQSNECVATRNIKSDRGVNFKYTRIFLFQLKKLHAFEQVFGIQLLNFLISY